MNYSYQSPTMWPLLLGIYSVVRETVCTDQWNTANCKYCKGVHLYMYTGALRIESSPSQMFGSHSISVLI